MLSVNMKDFLPQHERPSPNSERHHGLLLPAAAAVALQFVACAILAEGTRVGQLWVKLYSCMKQASFLNLIQTDQVPMS